MTNTLVLIALVATLIGLALILRWKLIKIDEQYIREKRNRNTTPGDGAE